MLIKNQIYEAVISDYTSEGQGVAKIEGCAVFIPNAIVGEKVTVRIEKAQKTRFFRGIYRNFKAVKEDLSPFFNPLTSPLNLRRKERKNERLFIL